MVEKQTAGRDNLGDFALKFAELNDDVLFGQVWSREDKLSPRDRSFLIVTALISQGAFEQLKYHMTKAKENGITNAEIYAGDAGRFMVDMASKNQKADVVFMDPPRAGSDEKFLSSVIKLGPKRVVYVSCNPETLARDLKYLTRHGYQAVKIQPVDNFPFCDHIETVVKLVRKK